MAPYISRSQKVGLALTVLALVNESEQIKRIKKKRKKWVKTSKRCQPDLIKELNSDDFVSLGIDWDTFNELLTMVRPFITKKDTVMRQAVSAEERLIATLRFLAKSQDYQDLGESTSISCQLLSKIVPETCMAIYKVLKDAIKMPATEDEWKEVAKKFEEKWQFNNCIGCMDCKHILIEKPPRTGSHFCNYKGKFSIILFAIVNANYEFIYVHTGTNGSVSDGGIKNTMFYEKLLNKDLNIPDSCKLLGTDLKLPYVFLSDNTNTLNMSNIIKPFSKCKGKLTREQRIFNYRLYRAKRVIDNTFGILASRFGIFTHPIQINIDYVDAIVLASCALHNFLKKKSKLYWTFTNIDHENIEDCTFKPGDWRKLNTLIPLESNNYADYYHGQDTRNALTDYFNSTGRITFQDVMTDVVGDI